MRIDELDNRHLIAGDGKVLRRISDSWIAGGEIYLGYAHYLNGEQVEVPFWELPEHYEEIVEEQEVAQEEGVLLDEKTVLQETVEVVSAHALMSTEPEIQVARTVTVADYVALEEKVREMESIINQFKKEVL